MSTETNERTQELIQSILTGMKGIMAAVNEGLPDQIESQVSSELRAIDSMLHGTLDVIEEGD